MQTAANADSDWVAQDYPAGPPVDRDEHYDIEQFLYSEARLLDEERFEDWLALLSPDISYRLPVRENIYRHNRRLPGGYRRTYILDEDHQDLAERVAKLTSGMAWVEDPAPRISRLVSNVAAWHTDRADVRRVYCKFLLYRSRRQIDLNLLGGSRHDILQRVDDGWRLLGREILLDQNVILDKNLFLLF